MARTIAAPDRDFLVPVPRRWYPLDLEGFAARRTGRGRDGMELGTSTVRHRSATRGTAALAAIIALLAGCPKAPPPLPVPAPAPVPVPVPAPAPAPEPTANSQQPTASFLPPEVAARLRTAAAWLLAGDGPLVRLRLFVPAATASATAAFDEELRAVAEALREAAPRLARVDVTVGPYDEAAVISMRGMGILPRTGGEPDTARALVVALGDVVTPIVDLSPARGRPAMQVLLALHRVLRGPVRIGLVAPLGDTASAAPLVDALAGFAVSPVDETTDPAGLEAAVVLAAGTAALPPWTTTVVRALLDAGRGVVVLGGPLAVRDHRAGREVVPSPSDPSRLLAGRGVGFGDGTVVDPSCARVSVPSGPGRLFLSYPPFVRTQVLLPDGGGEAVGVLPFASPLRIEESERVQVLARSSDESWIDDGEEGWDPSRAWRPGARLGSQPLAAAVRVPAAREGGDEGRLVVVSTAKFADAEGLAMDDDEALLAGMVAWAAGIEELLLVGGAGQGEEP